MCARQFSTGSYCSKWIFRDFIFPIIFSSSYLTKKETADASSVSGGCCTESLNYPFIRKRNLMLYTFHAHYISLKRNSKHFWYFLIFWIFQYFFNIHNVFNNIIYFRFLFLYYSIKQNNKMLFYIILTRHWIIWHWLVPFSFWVLWTYTI